MDGPLFRTRPVRIADVRRPTNKLSRSVGLRRHGELKIALGVVGVDRHGVPGHGVDAGRQRLADLDDQHAVVGGIDAGFAERYSRASLGAQRDARKVRLDALR